MPADERSAYDRLIDLMAQAIAGRKGTRWERLPPNKRDEYREDAEIVMRVLLGDGLLADDFQEKVEKLYPDPSSRPPADPKTVGEKLNMLRTLGAPFPPLRVVEPKDKPEGDEG